MSEEENYYYRPFLPGPEAEENPKCNKSEGYVAFKADAPPGDKSFGK